jgi:putative FmdB family regulatory protein
MPMYDYRCASCGVFREIRPMAESGAPRPCPGCGASCARLLCAPFLAGSEHSGGDGNRRDAHGRVPWRAACGLGCSHAH